MKTTVKCECGRDVPINPPQINADLMLICDHQAAVIKRLQALHAEIVDALYGQGFDVFGWHLNDDLEPLDNWFENNGWLDADEWKPTTGDSLEDEQ